MVLGSMVGIIVDEDDRRWEGGEKEGPFSSGVANKTSLIKRCLFLEFTPLKTTNLHQAQIAAPDTFPIK